MKLTGPEKQKKWNGHEIEETTPRMGAIHLTRD
jgi:hypothetical protein